MSGAEVTIHYSAKPMSNSCIFTFSSHEDTSRGVQIISVGLKLLYGGLKLFLDKCEP